MQSGDDALRVFSFLVPYFFRAQEDEHHFSTPKPQKSFPRSF
jgi:hypothetical protein